MNSIPVINLAPLLDDSNPAEVSKTIAQSCRTHGFFYVTGHGVETELQQRLERVSQQFFDLDISVKNQIRMNLGGRAWRGYFPVGSELTAGLPDQKEGVYFGEELPTDDPRVLAGRPLHGANLFPEVAEFRETVLEYINTLTQLGHSLMRGIALSLDLPGDYFLSRYTQDPLVLFRIFHYPALPREPKQLWSVGEHTDYGLLTILRQDKTGGLQIQSQNEWIDAPVIENAFVCNIGDMLDRMTGGVYKSTPHRVRNRSQVGRLSFPFFFDPNWESVIQPITPGQKIRDDKDNRWDNASVHDWNGTYGDYILSKVARVFPNLSDSSL